jgi:xanthine dehydrogenase accessory factor
MRKRTTPPDQRNLAHLVIGIGPGFIAKANVDLAIESAWGDDLGSIVTEGPTKELVGEPRLIEGLGRARVIYAPVSGRRRTERRIGEYVGSGDDVGNINGAPVVATLSGFLRGLTRDGIVIRAGTKIVEVDPRTFDRVNIRGLGERPRKIAHGVLSEIGNADQLQAT